jgi:NADH/NAD ratio-sensing transcriptional regulator Rex
MGARVNNRRQVPEACVARLSLYLRELAVLHRKRVGFVSSRWLAV